MALESKKKLVVLFRGDSSDTYENNKYLNLIAAEGIRVKSVSTLVINYISRDKLKRFLQDADSFSGIIFTSKHAVTAVSTISMFDNSILEKWRNKINFSVGKATADFALSLLKLDTRGSESGNSENLCQFIIENCGKFDKPFLFPCSSIRKDTIPHTLSKNGFAVEEIISYETGPCMYFETEWKMMISKEGLPQIVVFFSPSGVQSCLETIKNFYPEGELPKFVALGKSTESALLDKEIPCTVAEKPSPESVLKAVKNLLDD